MAGGCVQVGEASAGSGEAAVGGEGGPSQSSASVPCGKASINTWLQEVPRGTATVAIELAWHGS